MKTLVFSDSHGAVRPMLDAIQDHAPDLVLHLGDYTSDCAEVLRAYPRLALKSVRGNGDIFAKSRKTPCLKPKASASLSPTGTATA